jgi:hypothetical protein
MLSKIKENEKLQFGILLLLGLIFFGVYSFLAVNRGTPKFTWPDETANYFFIKNYISHGNFSVAEPLNKIASNIIKPRSFNVYQGNLVPGSFLGLLLIFGLIGKIITINLVLFLTPLLAAIAVIFFYKILLHIFKPNIAFISSLLLFVNPAWCYYANFAMLPNVSFLAFLLIGFCFILKIANQPKNDIRWLSLGSFSISLALIIRTNEFLWVLAILLFLGTIYFKKIRWYYPLIFIGVCVLVFLPIFYYNNSTFGSPLSFGYLKLEQGDSLVQQLPPEFSNANHPGFINFIKFLVFPFGFSPLNSAVNIYKYYASLLWWLFIPMLLGIFSLIKNFQKQAKAVYLLIFLCLSGYLILYYGSWVFEDKMTLSLNKIGISYVRYFLPIYILATPLVAVFYFNLINLLKAKKIKIIMVLFLIASNLFLTYNLLYRSGNDNLAKMKKTIQDYQYISQQINTITEPDAIIISQRSDKIFFPERKVIGKWTYDEISNWQNLLLAGHPLYYYAYESPADLDEFSYNIAVDFNLELVDEIKINDNDRLYKLILNDYEDY